MTGLSPEASHEAVNYQAWRLVDPRNPVFGQERVGVVLARHALSLAGGEPEAVARYRDTFAWACYRIRDFAQAHRLCATMAFGPDASWDGSYGMPSLSQKLQDWEDGTAADEYTLLDEDRASLERESADWRTWEFADPRDRWWHGQLTLLVQRLQRLSDHLHLATVAADAPGWDRAIAAIASLPVYGGLRIARQLDLVPLDPDPQSGLWEFAHLPSGTPPTRRAEDGKLVLRPASGLVFVLLPAGKDCPAPFLISKYELTLAQWERLSHRWTWRPGRAFGYPITAVAWDQAAELLRRTGGWLHLPNVAAWLQARSAGTNSRFWTGDEPASLKGAENVKHESKAPTFLMRSGALRANPFGLHDMEGNVSEWCSDAAASVAGDGRRDDYSVLQRTSAGYRYTTEPTERLWARPRRTWSTSAFCTRRANQSMNRASSRGA